MIRLDGLVKLGHQHAALEQVSGTHLGELLSTVQAAPWFDRWLAVEIDPEATPEYLEAEIDGETGAGEQVARRRERRRWPN